MKLNHINLVVTDVAAAVAFFVRYFGFTCGEVKGDNAIAILNGADDFLLVLMTAKEPPAYPDAFHIGFMQDSNEQVTELYERLKDNNMIPVNEPRKIRNSFGFYFHFQGIMIEVACQE